MYITEIVFHEPIEIYRPFAKEFGAILLDSSSATAETKQKTARYSFVAIDPFQILSSKNGKVILHDRLNAQTQTIKTNPWVVLQKQYKKYHLEPIPNFPPFIGGAAGFFSYELNHYLEKLPAALKDDLQFPDLFLGFYDLVISFDLLTKQAWICSSGFPESNLKLRNQRATQRCSWLQQVLTENSTLSNNYPTKNRNANFIANEQHTNNSGKLTPTDQLLHNSPDLFKMNEISSNFSQQEYEQAVAKVKDYILAGDIFQANIAQRFQAKLANNLTPFELYSQLREINPAPFAAFVNAGNTCISSSSPERFIRLHTGQVETSPIKGTIHRSKDLTQDEILRQQLAKSSKDQAENIMIVDLLRNDLSKVCLPGSIKVTELCAVKTFSQVHHLVSTITAQLAPKNTAIDLLKATFPGGSITGAPKIRAMEIITEVEQLARGPYCGCIGYLGFDGNMDTSITIRTFAIKNQVVTFHAGGAVTLDSEPTNEYEETLTKANSLLQALCSRKSENEK